MVFGWFNAREEKLFGESLAAFFVQRISPDVALRDKEIAKKVDRVLEQMQMQIRQYKLTHKLNLYRRAQLGNAFKWKMLEAGFSQAYVDELTKWVVVSIA